MLSTLAALAEPNRLHIVELLRENPRSVNDIAAELHLSQPLVSRHLHVLTQAGLVKARAVAQQRIYRLEALPFRELNGWLETFRRQWNARLDTLDEYVQELKEQEKHETAGAPSEETHSPDEHD